MKCALCLTWLAWFFKPINCTWWQQQRRLRRWKRLTHHNSVVSVHTDSHPSLLGRFRTYILPRLYQNDFHSEPTIIKQGGTISSHYEVIILSIKSLAIVRDQFKIVFKRNRVLENFQNNFESCFLFSTKWRTLRKKVKLLKLSNFTFFHKVF